MDQVIKTVADKLGIDQLVARQALGAVLVFLKKQSAGTSFDFEKVSSKVKGMNDVVKEAEVQPKTTTPTTGNKSSSSPIQDASFTMEGVMKMVFSLCKSFGVFVVIKRVLESVYPAGVQMIQSVEDGGDLSTLLSDRGINHKQGADMINELVNFLKSKVDPAVIDNLVESIPAVKLFLKDPKKSE